MKDLLEVAAGSVIGREHLLAGKNNQDAYYAVSGEQLTIAVVCDGCGSGNHSEVGAKIGARLVVEVIWQLLDAGASPVADSFWQQVRQEVLTQLQYLAEVMGRNFTQTVNSYFLFTIIGVLVTPAGATIFSIGDGVIIVNGNAIQLRPFPGNNQPYLGYGILDASPEFSQFRLHIPFLAIAEFKSILIGTNGVNDLIDKAECHLPGKQDVVGSINQFWEKDFYFKNPDMVRHQLSLINQEVTKPDWQGFQLIKAVGLLPDDTTLIAIRKRSK